MMRYKRKTRNCASCRYSSAHGVRPAARDCRFMHHGCATPWSKGYHHKCAWRPRPPWPSHQHHLPAGTETSLQVLKAFITNVRGHDLHGQAPLPAGTKLPGGPGTERRMPAPVALSVGNQSFSVGNRTDGRHSQRSTKSMTVKLSEIRSVRCTISRANGRLDADVVWCSPRTTARTGQPLDMVFASRVMRAASAHEIIGRRSEINMCSLSSTSLAVLVRPAADTDRGSIQGGLGDQAMRRR